LLLLLIAPPARADYKDSFKKGMEATDRKRWDEVVKHMQAAAAENTNEGERLKLYGLRFEVYFPHFYLGAAYLNLGKCPEAVKEFKISQSQGAIRSSPKYAELVDGLKSCEGTPPVPTAAPTPRTVVTLPPTAVPAPTALPTAPAMPTARPAIATPVPAPPSLPTPSQKVAPPPALLKAAQAYFDSNYEDAVSLASKAGGSTARANAQSLLLRSAARFALWKIGGQKNADLRRQAAEDAAACHRLDPALQPDAAAFSPEFADFFKSSR
jgi:hypothetical protein